MPKSEPAPRLARQGFKPVNARRLSEKHFAIPKPRHTVSTHPYLGAKTAHSTRVRTWPALP